jgi:5S rRNA maturation endonuclease (ribonuclease M5)
VKWNEFPKRTNEWGGPDVAYFKEHGIKLKDVMGLDSIYPTEKGLCFLLVGMNGRSAYQERLTVSWTGSRWCNPSNVNLSGFVYKPWSLAYNIPESTDHVFIVEGSTDALRLHTLGYLAIGILGVSIPKERVEVVEYLCSKLNTICNKKVRAVLIPDNDGPGESLVRRLVTKIPTLGVSRLPHTVKDVCDMKRSELCIFLKQQH